MRNNLSKLLVFLIIICGLTFPFHWVISEPIIVPKENLSLSNTFISADEVSEIVERYYFGSPAEKFKTDDDPLTIALVKRWKVEKTEDGSTIFYHLTK